MTPLQQRLFALQEEKYRELQRSTIPTVAPERILGVRTPALRALAKELAQTGEGEALLQKLPHEYFEEDQLHAFLLAGEKDFARCLTGVEAFLPYVDNWATCDQMTPKVFARHRGELLPHIDSWLASDHEYTVRFGVKMLMDHFLKEDFSPAYPARVAALRREEYYIRMMQAWYFATALTFQWEAALPFLEERRLERWVHNKSIQKAVESYRIPPERKEALRALRQK